MNKYVIKPLLSPLIFLMIIGCETSEQANVDRLFESYTGDVPGAAVMVIKDGKTIFSKAYGLADLEKKTLIETRTNFRLASVTKQFTAMCIMKLVEDGKLDYTSSLTDLFPGFPDYGKDITIQNLLQHTSGLIAYESLIPDIATIQVSDMDVLNLMKTQDSTYFPPGSNYRYSNSGYALLANIIKNLSGRTFVEFLTENVFDPLGMVNSVAFKKNVSTVNFRAFGYANTDSGFVFKDQSRTSAVLGDGGIYTSIEEMFLWDQALYTDKLVKYETLAKAFEPGVLTNGDTLDYGFGWRIDKYKGLFRVHHTGSTSGFRNVIQRYPEEKFTVIILTNRAGPDVTKLAEQLTDLFLTLNLEP